MDHPHTPRFWKTSTFILLAALAWIATGLTAIGLGALDDPPRFAPALMILGQSLAIGLLFWRVEPLRAWLAELDPRWLVAPHLVRALFGASFLVVAARGQLPAVFADTAGYGDLLAAALAAAALASSPDTRRGRVLLWAFNVIGALDILLVFITAQRLIIAGDPLLISTLTKFPFATLPCFVVPMVFATHAGIFASLLRRRPVPDAPRPQTV